LAERRQRKSGKYWTRHTPSVSALRPSDSVDALREEIMDEALRDGKRPKAWGTFWIVSISVILVLLTVFMIIPYYSIPLDPHPNPVSRDVLQKFDFKPVNHTSNLQEVWSMISASDMKPVAETIAIAGCADQQDICYAKTLYYFVRNEVQYIKDPVLYEYIKDPQTTLATYAGDCDDQAVLLASLLYNVGIPVDFVIVPRHMLLKANLPHAKQRYKGPDGWVYLDPTCKNCGFGELSREVARQIAR